MSILVKGIGMPTCCCWCPFCRRTYTEWGSIYSADCIIKKMPIKFSELDLRDGLCPLAEAPEDVQPVVKARWVYTNMSRLVCSNCGNPVAFSLKEDGWHHGDFCPNCGAKMDGEVNG